ncbi:hypothetical protein [Arsenophonus nasoniae]|uniref:Uncharacterized protein n=1 Tax=Arsenophonus nasoniae TaxID=638 RepID=A0AA95K8F1_9GAMM|nr:hypothetical protein [Arsenophonus nasoniae]WGL95867.1 hypothetical protein QE207_04550 [Arsenophonus nasoniae]
MAEIKQLSSHRFIYRNSVIVKLSRKAIMPITRYHVGYENDSFGKFDAITQA